MANVIGELVWKITGDATAAKKSLNEIDKNTQKTAKSVQFLEKAFLVGLAVNGVKALKNIAKETINAASEAEETSNKFGVVFRTVIDEANQLADVLARDYNIATTESKDLLAATGDLLVGFGVARDQALDLSFQVQTLAADLVSFTNFSGGTTGASKALTSALLGETEAAKSLGLALGETQLRQFAEQQGEVFKELTINEKAFLRLQLAQKQAADAVGDVARNTDTYAFQLRRADKINRDFTDYQGAKLLPIATEALTLYNDWNEALFDFQKSTDAAIKTLGEYADALIRVGEEASTAFEGTFDEALAEAARLLDILKTSAVSFADSIGDIATDISTFVKELLGIKENSEEATDGLGILATAVQGTAIVFKALSLSIAGGINAIKNFVRSIIDSAKIIGTFYETLSGEKSWSDLQKSVDVARNSFSKFGSDAVKDARNLYKTIGEEVDNFGKKQDNLRDRLNKALVEPQKKVQETTKKAIEQQEDQIAKTSELRKEYDKLIAAQSGFVAALDNASFESFKTFSEISKNIRDIQVTYQVATSGIIGALQAIDQLQQVQAENRLQSIDAQEQRELEAAGLAEETAIQRAERELELAEQTGTEEEKVEARNALKKAQIEEKFAKKRAETEYQASLASWEIQKALAAINLAAAPLNAYVSSLAAPWPLNMILAPINAALAAVTAGIQYAAVVQAKPVKPKFQFGGIVPGSRFAGDSVEARVNSGEMVLNQQQQAELFNMANGQGRGGERVFKVIGTREATFDELFRAMQNGELFVPERAIVTR
jgi:hypothetical protein